mmetsp:Transcript_8891/g.24628  ORF Transcript_8891/g.24628 Transcript_8891/m.24628 type:complete len:200 (+) Transcript_8891:150-749(+)
MCINNSGRQESTLSLIGSFHNNRMNGFWCHIEHHGNAMVAMQMILIGRPRTLSNLIHNNLSGVLQTRIVQGQDNGFLFKVSIGGIENQGQTNIHISRGVDVEPTIPTLHRWALQVDNRLDQHLTVPIVEANPFLENSLDFLACLGAFIIHPLSSVRSGRASSQVLCHGPLQFLRVILKCGRVTSGMVLGKREKHPTLCR